jgi:hypothetical protein
MPTDEDLEKRLEWSYEKLGGDASATAAAGLAILRGMRKFERASNRLGWAMAVMTLVLTVLTAVLVCLTYKLIQH